MCDYSLEHIASRDAKVSDELVTTRFSMTGGFSEAGKPDVAVCLRPGTELAFDSDAIYETSVLFFGILATLWSGWAAADAMIKAINRAYELQETRAWWKLWGISLLMILGFMLVIATLALVVFGPEVGGYVQGLTGLPDAFLALWGILRWALAFLAVTLAHNLLYYLAPNARIPFKWITPGGFTATVLILVSSAALNLYVVNFARYNQIYGQVGAIIVLMVWLYSTGLMVLIGAEINAVLVRMAEERKNTELVQAESPAN